MREQLLICALLVLAACKTANAAACYRPSQDRECFKNQTVYFDSGSSVVNDEAKRKVGEVAKYLELNPSAALTIEGHCDDRGTFKHNYALGERRAWALRRKLIRLGVDPSRVDTFSYGKNRPADWGNGTSARKKNRRAEFVLLTMPMP